MPLRAASPHHLEAPKKHPWGSNAAAGCQSAQLGSSLLLKCCNGLPACTVWNKLWFKIAPMPLQPTRTAAPLESTVWCSSVRSGYGAQMPLRAASSHRLAAAGCLPAPLGGSFGAQMPLRAASPHRLEAAFGAHMPLRAENPHRLEAALVVKCRCGLPAHAA